jgi:hypothetical protein
MHQRKPNVEFLFLWLQFLGGIVTTLALGLRPRQGVARLRAKSETQESHHMLPKVQRVWGNEPSHSQVNSNYVSWSPKWTPKFSKRDCRGQNPSFGKVVFIIGKLWKFRCLKWACIAHLDIWNTSYDQKKGCESNWQFDSRPLKVRDRPDFLVCRRCVTYCWRALDEGYSIALDLITIGGLHAKLWAPKVAGVPIEGISGLPLGSPGTKRSFGCGPHGVVQSIEYTIRGKVVASPKSRPWWVLWVWFARGSS